MFFRLSTGTLTLGLFAVILSVVEQANALGITYLRAQTLPEPVRTRSLTLPRHFTDTSIRISETVPRSDAQEDAIADNGRTRRELWALAGQALQTPSLSWSHSTSTGRPAVSFASRSLH